jgi:hypothetical protein
MFSLYAQFILFDNAVNIFKVPAEASRENNVVDANQRHFFPYYHE